MTEDQALVLERMLSHDLYVSPLRFALWAYPWGEGDLRDFDGPRQWQRDVMEDIEEYLTKALWARENGGVLPDFYRHAIASGRGPGKSALVGMLTHWFISTRIGGSAWVAANGEPQLRTKTFPEIAKWVARGINSEFFDVNAMSIQPATWFQKYIESPEGLKSSTKYYYVSGQLWSKENPDAFAGAHNYQGEMAIFDEACHDSETDVLTKRGWVAWPDVVADDEFMTMNPITHEIEYQKAIKLHVYDHDGDMCHYKVRGADIFVTPNHKMYYTTRKLKGVYKKRQISDLKSDNCYFKRTLNWIGNEQQFHIIPAITTNRKQFDEKRIDMDTWLEFLGWYMSEGHLVSQNGLLLAVGISNNDPVVLRRCEHLFTLMGYSPKTYKCSGGLWQVRVHDRQLASSLGEYGIGCKVKRIPSYVRFLSQRQIRIYLNSHRDGDGYFKDKAEIIYTSSIGLADDLHELYLKSGMRCSLSTRALAGNSNWIIDHWGTSSIDGYVVRASPPTLLKYKEQYMTRKHYTGKVYCAEVPNHLLYTRRNGYTVWSGNSGVPDEIWPVQANVFTENIVDRFWLAFSNPRKASGAFFECFHKNRDMWRTTQIDSRSVEGISHSSFENTIKEFGEESNEAKVEVYGQFPTIGDNQFIGAVMVDEAIGRVRYEDESAPVVVGVDVARFGSDKTVIAVRKGRDLVSIRKFSGLDTMEVVGKVIEAIDEWSPALTVIDEGGLGAGVVDRLKEQRYKIRGVNFGSKADSQGFANKRAEMWGGMKEWLKTASIGSDSSNAAQDNRYMKADLTGPTYKCNSVGAILIESKDDMKKRGIASPDAADAVAITFAYPVSYGEARKPLSDKLSRKFSGMFNRGTRDGAWMS